MLSNFVPVKWLSWFVVDVDADDNNRIQLELESLQRDLGVHLFGNKQASHSRSVLNEDMEAIGNGLLPFIPFLPQPWQSLSFHEQSHKGARVAHRLSKALAVGYQY